MVSIFRLAVDSKRCWQIHEPSGPAVVVAFAAGTETKRHVTRKDAKPYGCVSQNSGRGLLSVPFSAKYRPKAGPPF